MHLRDSGEVVHGVLLEPDPPRDGFRGGGGAGGGGGGQGGLSNWEKTGKIANFGFYIDSVKEFHKRAWMLMKMYSFGV